jgi:peptide/nickel transport system substrate-binding protein
MAAFGLFKRKTSTRTLVVLLIASALVGVTGCAENQAKDSGKTDGGRVEGGTITYAHFQEPTCINGGWIQQAYLSRQVFDDLIAINDAGEAVPWLATSWKESEDRKTITFQLREDVKFTDGTPLNAAAVVANFPNWQKQLGWLAFTYITGLTEVAEFTVDLHLEIPNPDIYYALATGHFGIQSPTALANNSEEQNCLQPVGSGPWIVEAWDRGEAIHFVRNPDYNWSPSTYKHQGPAHAERLEWKIVPDATTRWGAFTNGEADVAYDTPSAQWKTAQAEYQTFSFIGPGRPLVLSFNVARPPFNDKKVRQAFAYAADRKKIVKTVFKGQIPFEGNGALAKTTLAAVDQDDSYSYDPTLANKLLDEAGWTERDKDGYRVKDGQTLEARLRYNQAMVTTEGSLVYQAIQDQVKEVGIKVTLIPLTLTEAFAGKVSGVDEYEIDTGYWTWRSPNILDIVYRAKLGETHNGNNPTYFDNPEIEAQIRDAQIDPDPESRKKKYIALQEYFNDEAVAIGVYNLTVNAVASNNVKGLWQDQGNGSLIFYDAYLGKE